MPMYFYIKYQPIRKPHILHFLGFLPTMKGTRAFSLLFQLSNNTLQDTFFNTVNSEVPTGCNYRKTEAVDSLKFPVFIKKEKKFYKPLVPGQQCKLQKTVPCYLL